MSAIHSSTRTRAPRRRGFRRACTAALLAAPVAALALAAPPAGAVVSTSGVIEVDDALNASTLDVQYFSLSGPVTDGDFLVNVVSPGPDDNIAAALYDLTGGGAFTPLLAIESGAPGLDSFTITRSLGIGDYAFVVGLFELLPNEFPPLQIDPNTPSGIGAIEYEISIIGFDGEVGFTCRRAGNLDGSQSVDVFVSGAACPPPPAEVDAPATAGLLFAGLAGVGGILARRRRR